MVFWTLSSTYSTLITHLPPQLHILFFSICHQDSEVYSIVMNRIDPVHCPVIPDEPLMSRAAKAISIVRAFGADIFIKPKVRAKWCSMLFLLVLCLCYWFRVFACLFRHSDTEIRKLKLFALFFSAGHLRWKQEAEHLDGGAVIQYQPRPALRDQPQAHVAGGHFFHQHWRRRRQQVSCFMLVRSSF